MTKILSRLPITIEIKSFTHIFVVVVAHVSTKLTDYWPQRHKLYFSLTFCWWEIMSKNQLSSAIYSYLIWWHTQEVAMARANTTKVATDSTCQEHHIKFCCNLIVINIYCNYPKQSTEQIRSLSLQTCTHILVMPTLLTWLKPTETIHIWKENQALFNAGIYFHQNSIETV